jgi:hypothetical protein
MQHQHTGMLLCFPHCTAKAVDTALLSTRQQARPVMRPARLHQRVALHL